MAREKNVVAPRFMSTLEAISIATNMEEIRKRKKYRFPVYMGKDFMNADLEVLELSVRSNNCLHRAGFRTVGELVEQVESDDDLKKIRNCGKTSVTEIMLSLICFQYELMDTDRRKKFVKRINELNGEQNGNQKRF